MPRNLSGPISSTPVADADVVQLVDANGNTKNVLMSMVDTYVSDSEQTEAGHIRTFVGKTAAGSETPSYSSQNYVTDGDSLETAIGGLDTQAKTNADAISALGFGQPVTLALVKNIGMQNGDGKQTLYTVPADTEAVVTHVVIMNPTASLAGGTDYNIGTGAGADTHKETIDLSGLTSTTGCYVISLTDSVTPVLQAADVFGIISETGATLDAEATVAVIGFKIDLS